MFDNHTHTGIPRLLLSYDPLSSCDADQEAKSRRLLYLHTKHTFMNAIVRFSGLDQT